MKAKKRVHSFRHILFVGVSVLFFILILLLLFVIFYRPTYKGPNTADWKTGDIFFSVGDSWKSVAVRALTGAKEFELPDSTPSHCGIVIRDKKGIWLVHESTSEKRLVMERPDEYVKKNGSFCLFSKPTPCEIDTNLLRKNIERMIHKGIPFDYRFNNEDTTSLYCTEFVVYAFEKAGCNNFSELHKQQYIYPKDLEKICAKRKKE